MANYTIQLRTLCDLYSRQEIETWFSNYNLSDFLTSAQIQLITQNGIWTKEKLASKIVDHFYMREIAFETPELFHHYVNITMKELMEEYLPVIYSNAIEYDPLVNVDFTETFSRTINNNAENQGSSTSNSQNSAEGFNINNDTPQTNISKQNLDSGFYASNTNQSETSSNISDTTNTNSSGQSNTLENFTRHQKGNSGISTTAQKLIEQYRDIIRAVDNEIINRLNKLFFSLF